MKEKYKHFSSHNSITTSYILIKWPLLFQLVLYLVLSTSVSGHVILVLKSGIRPATRCGRDTPIASIPLFNQDAFFRDQPMNGKVNFGVICIWNVNTKQGAQRFIRREIYIQQLQQCRKIRIFQMHIYSISLIKSVIYFHIFHSR